MADDRSYFVNPESGKMMSAPAEDAELAQQHGYIPATEQQVSAFLARQEVKKSPTTQRLAAAAEGAAEALTWPGGLASLLVSQVPSVTEIGAKFGVVEPETAEMAKQIRLDMAAGISKYATAPGLEQTLGISTPEAIEARREVFPLARLAGGIAGMVGPGAAVKVAEKAGLKFAGEEAAAQAAAAEAARRGDAVALAAASDIAKSAGRMKAAAEATQAAGKVVGAPAKALDQLAESLAPITQVVENSAYRAVNASPILRRMPDTAKEIIAKTSGRALGTAIQGAALQAGVIGGDLSLGDPELVAEKAMSEIAAGAIFGVGAEIGLGLGVPLAGKVITAPVDAALKMTRRGLSQIRDWLLKHYPEKAADFIGVDVRNVKDMLDMRNTVPDGNFREKLREQMRGPVEARVDEARLKQGLPVLVQPTPLVPSLMPEPIKPSVLVDEEKAARELADALQAQADGMRTLTTWTQRLGRKIETSTFIRQKVQREIDSDYQAFLASVGNRPMTGKEAEMGELIQAGVFARKPYSDALDEFVREAETLEGQLGLPSQWPEMVRGRLGSFFDRLREFAASNPSPEQMQPAIQTLKQELWGKGQGRGVRDALASLDMATNGKIDALRRSAKRFTEDPDLWGEAAFRQAESNEVYERYLKVFNDEIRKKLLAYSKQQNKFVVKRDNVAAFVKGLKPDPATGVPSESTRQRWEWLRDWNRLASDVVDDARRSNKNAGILFDDNMLNATIGETIGASDKAMQAAIKKAENKVLLTQYQKDLKTIKKMNKQELERVTGINKQELDDYEQYLKEKSKQTNSELDLLTEKKRLNFIEAFGAESLLEMAPMPEEIKRPLQVIYAARKAKNIAYGDPARMGRLLGQIERFANRVDNRIEDSINALTNRTNHYGMAGGYPVAPLAYSYGTTKKEREKYKEAISTIGKLTQDSLALQDHLDSSIGTLDQYAPNVSEKITQKTALAAMFLASKIPQMPQGLSPFEAAAWEPTDAQVRQFNKIYHAVDMPLSILEDAKAGILTKDQVEAVATVYPSLMSEIRNKLRLRMLEAPETITREQRAMISRLLMVDLDGAAKPQSAISAQSIYGSLKQPPPQRQQQVPVSRAQGLNVSGRAGLETAAWREAQKDYGR